MARAMRLINWALAQPMIWFVVVWRLIISPLYGPVCKHYPSCSAYCLEALRIHGAFPGAWLTVRRISRCHPWSSGGYDPVPPAGKNDYDGHDDNDRLDHGRENTGKRRQQRQLHRDETDIELARRTERWDIRSDGIYTASAETIPFYACGGHR